MIQTVVAELAEYFGQSAGERVERGRALISVAPGINHAYGPVQREGVIDEFGHNSTLDVPESGLSPHAGQRQRGRQTQLSQPMAEPKLTPLFRAFDPRADTLTQSINGTLFANDGELVPCRPANLQLGNLAAVRIFVQTLLGIAHKTFVNGL